MIEYIFEVDDYPSFVIKDEELALKVFKLLVDDPSCYSVMMTGKRQIKFAEVTLEEPDEEILLQKVSAKPRRVKDPLLGERCGK